MIQLILDTEAVIFVAYGVLVAGVGLYLNYLIRRWSWIPRKRQRRTFTERW